MNQIENNKNLRIIAVSDNHGEYYNTKNLVNESGDIIIFAGDFTYYGTDSDFDLFINFLDALKGFKHKIVISGNHQIVLDQDLPPQRRLLYLKQFPCKYTKQFIQAELKKRAIYLQHQYVEVEGLKIFGSPYTSYHCGSAFQIKPASLQARWSQIPEGLDILITHGPPYQILDRTSEHKNAGCRYLRKRVFEVKPKVHLFGHIHEGRPKFGQLPYIRQNGVKFYNVAHKPTLITFQ